MTGPLELVLIRGLPGSGKSTLAKTKYPLHALVESDMWFIRVGPYGHVYRYNPQELRDAHEWCQRQTECLLRNGKNVVVANTFVTRWEVAPYAAIAFRVGAVLRIEVATGSYTNIHEVPEEVINDMRKRWESFSV